MNSLLRLKHSKAEAKRFDELFGVDLESFWDVTGFDVIKFDEEFVKPPYGVSTADAIRSRYGSEACTFVRGLIGA